MAIENLVENLGSENLGSNLAFRENLGSNLAFSTLGDVCVGTMARPLRILYPMPFIVTSRGNDRRAIFRDDHDRTRFLERLRIAKEIFSVRVHAYVLMSNHFHLIVETPKANLSEFMGRG